MSGYRSSKRQWLPKHVRVLAAALLALMMLIPMVSAAYASGEGDSAAGSNVRPRNVLCVDGSVINFDETAMGKGWKITATPIDPEGAAIQTETDSDGEFSFDNLTVGLWEFAITLGDGWDSITPDKFTVMMDYGHDKCAVIRFKIKRPVPVTVLKIDDNHVPLADWVIKASPAYGNWFASPITATTDVNGEAQFLLTEGKWEFTEKAPKDTTYVPVMPSSGKQELDVEWNDGQPIMIRFKNRLTFQGCIEAYKLDVPPPPAGGGDPGASWGLPGWKITVKRTNGSVVTSGYTDSMGYVKFKNLPLGPYIVEEEARIGWSPVTPTSFTVNLVGGTCEPVTFYNEQSPPGFCIEGRKIDHNGMIGIPGWKITATPIYKGGYPNEKTDGATKIEVFTDGQGKFRIDLPGNDYRIPGAAYKVCEEEKTGWLPHTALCQTVYVPYKAGACAKAWDFVNQQVGHWESITIGPASGSSSCETSYTVQAGDSLCGIGAAYGVSCGAMFAANPWVYNNPNHYVYAGQSVCIP